MFNWNKCYNKHTHILTYKKENISFKIRFLLLTHFYVKMSWYKTFEFKRILTFSFLCIQYVLIFYFSVENCMNFYFQQTYIWATSYPDKENKDNIWNEWGALIIVKCFQYRLSEILNDGLPLLCNKLFKCHVH